MIIRDNCNLDRFVNLLFCISRGAKCLYFGMRLDGILGVSTKHASCPNRWSVAISLTCEILCEMSLCLKDLYLFPCLAAAAALLCVGCYQLFPLYVIKPQKVKQGNV